MKTIKHYFAVLALVLVFGTTNAQKFNFSPNAIPFDSSVTITVKGKNTLFTDSTMKVYFHNTPASANANYPGVSVTGIDVVNDTLLTATLRISDRAIVTNLRCIVSYRMLKIVADSAVRLVSPYIGLSIPATDYREKLNPMQINCFNFNLDNDTLQSLGFYKNGIPVNGIRVDSLKKLTSTTARAWVYLPYHLKPDTYEVKVSTTRTLSAPGTMLIRNPMITAIAPSNILAKNDTSKVTISAANAMFMHGAKAPFIIRSNSTDTFFAYDYEAVSNGMMKAGFRIMGLTGLYDLVLYDSINGYQTGKNYITVKGPEITDFTTTNLFRDSFFKAMVTAKFTHFNTETNTITFYKDGTRNGAIEANIDSVANETTLFISMHVHRLAPAGNYTVVVENARDGQVGSTIDINVKGGTRITVSPNMMVGNKQNKVSIFGSGKHSPNDMVAFRNNPTMRISLLAKDTFEADSFTVVSDTLIHAYFTLPFAPAVALGAVHLRDSINTLLTSLSFSLRKPWITSIQPYQVAPGDTVELLLTGDGNIFDSLAMFDFVHVFDSSKNNQVTVDSTRKISSDSMLVYIHTSTQAADRFPPVLHYTNGRVEKGTMFLGIALPVLTATPQSQQFRRAKVKELSFVLRNSTYLTATSIRFTAASGQLLQHITIDSFYRKADSLYVRALIADSLRSNMDFYLEARWNNNSVSRGMLRMLPPQLTFIAPGELRNDSQAVFCYTGQNLGIANLQPKFYRSSALVNNQFTVDSFSFGTDTLKLHVYIGQEAGGAYYNILLGTPHDGTFDTSEFFFIKKYTGMMEHDGEKARVSPNPVSANATITINMRAITGKAELVSVEGRRFPLTGSSNEKDTLSVNLAELGLRPGLYFLHVYDTGGNLNVKKIIVQ